MCHLDVLDCGTVGSKMAKILNEGRLESHMHPDLEFMIKEDKHSLSR